MRNLLLVIMVFTGFLSRTAAVFAESGNKPAVPTSVIAPNAADFAARLPAKVYIMIGTADANEATARGIEGLGRTPGTEFLLLPKDAIPPKAVRQSAPEYPRYAGQGQARVLGLISTSGEVVAVYCLSATHPAFGSAAAEAVGHWKYKPAKLNGTAIPVIFTQLMEFSQ